MVRQEPKRHPGPHDPKARSMQFAGGVSFYLLVLITIFSAFSEGNTNLQWLCLAIAISVAVIGRVIPGILSGVFTISHPWLLLPLVATVVFAFSQTLPSPFSGSKISRDPYETTLFVLAFAALIIFFEAISTLANSFHRIRLLAILVIVIGVASSAFGLAELYLVPQGVGHEGFAQYGNRNHFLLIVEMSLGLVAGLVLKGGIGAVWRWAALLSGGFLLYAAIVVGSRGGLMSIAAMLVIGIFLHFTVDRRGREHRDSRVRVSTFRKTIVASGVALSILIGIVILTAIVGGERTVSRFENLQRETKLSPDRLNRAAIWKATAELVKENPIIGIGYGAYSVAIARYDRSDGSYPIEYAHNDYLEILASGGVVGALLLIIFLSLLVKRTADGLISAGSEYAPYRLGASIGLCGVAMHSFVDFGLHIAVNVLCALILIAIAVSPPLENLSGARSLTSLRVPGKALRRTAALAYAISAVTIAYLCCVYGLATYYAAESRRLGDLPLADRAAEIDPSNPIVHISRAEILASLGEFEAASNALAKAIELREQDPFLWIRLGHMRDRSADREGAMDAFVRSSELAPSFYQPWVELGDMMIAVGDNELGYVYYRGAALRNREFLFDLIERAESMFPNDPITIERLLVPSDIGAKRVVANHFVARGWITPNVMKFLTVEELSVGERNEYVTRLIETGDYANAHAIWVTLSAQPEELRETNVANGGFEYDDPKENRSFGWQADDDLASVAISRIGAGAHTGSHALRVRFGGSVEGSGLPSNLVFLRPRTNYELSFAFRTEGLVSAALPTIRVMDAGTMSPLIVPVIIDTETPGWKMIRRRFVSGETPAVYINLGRENCSMSPCPIFGDLYLDSFEIRQQ